MPDNPYQPALDAIFAPQPAGRSGVPTGYYAPELDAIFNPDVSGDPARAQAARMERQRIVVGGEDTGPEIHGINRGDVYKKMIPFGSAIRNAARADDYKVAREAFEKHEATDDQLATIARYEREQGRERSQGMQGEITRSLMGIPAIVGESTVGPARLVLGGKTALGMAARGAASTPLMPSLYLEQAEQSAIEKGGEFYHPKNLAPALALGAIQNTILGTIGRQVGSVRGGLPGKVLAGTAFGMAEQQGADIVGGLVDEVLPEAYRMKTGYGLGGQAIRGEDDALKHATVQAVTFAAFSALHAGQHKPVLDSFSKATDALAESGVPREQAGEVISKTIQPIVDAATPTPPVRKLGPSPVEMPKPAEAVKQALDAIPDGPIKDYAKEVAKAVVEQPKETARSLFDQLSEDDATGLAKALGLSQKALREKSDNPGIRQAIEAVIASRQKPAPVEAKPEIVPESTQAEAVPGVENRTAGPEIVRPERSGAVSVGLAESAGLKDRIMEDFPEQLRKPRFNGDDVVLDQGDRFISGHYDAASNRLEIGYMFKMRGGGLQKELTRNLQPGSVDLGRTLAALTKAAKEKGIGIEYTTSDNETAAKEGKRGRHEINSVVLKRQGFHLVGEQDGPNPGERTYFWDAKAPERVMTPEERIAATPDEPIAPIEDKFKPKSSIWYDVQNDLFGGKTNRPRPSPKAIQDSLITKEMEIRAQTEHAEEVLRKMAEFANPTVEDVAPNLPKLTGKEKKLANLKQNREDQTLLTMIRKRGGLNPDTARALGFDVKNLAESQPGLFKDSKGRKGKLSLEDLAKELTDDGNLPPEVEGRHQHEVLMEKILAGEAYAERSSHRRAEQKAAEAELARYTREAERERHELAKAIIAEHPDATAEQIEQIARTAHGLGEKIGKIEVAEGYVDDLGSHPDISFDPAEFEAVRQRAAVDQPGAEHVVPEAASGAGRDQPAGEQGHPRPPEAAEPVGSGHASSTEVAKSLFEGREYTDPGDLAMQLMRESGKAASFENVSFGAQRNTLAGEKAAPSRLDQLKESGRRAFNNAIDVYRKMAGAVAPNIRRLSEKAANAVAYVDRSRQYAQVLAEETVDRIMPEEHKRASDREIVGAVIVEERLRDMRNDFIARSHEAAAKGDADAAEELMGKAKGVSSIVGEYNPSMRIISPLVAERDFQHARNLPWVQEAIANYEKYASPILDEYFRKSMMMEPMEPINSNQRPERVVSMIVMTPEELIAANQNAESEARAMGEPGRGNMGKRYVRKLGASNEAKGSAAAYHIDLGTMIERTLRDRVPLGEKANMYKTLADEGIGAIVKPGVQKFTEDGRAFRRIPRWTAPRNFGLEGRTDLLVHPDAFQEVRQVIGEDQPVPRLPGSNVFASLAIASTLEYTYHSRNQLTQLFAPGMRPIRDVLGSAISLWKNSPEIRKELLELSRIDALKDSGSEAGVGKGQYAKLDPRRILKFSGQLIDLQDRAIRIASMRAFDRMAADPSLNFDRSESARRDFINQIGNYSRNTQHWSVALLRDLGIGPFATAGSNFYANGLRRLAGGSGLKALDWKTEARLRATVLGRMAVMPAMAAVINTMLWGRPDGDDKTPLGHLKVMEKGGKSYTVDLVGMTGFTRGARALGLMGLAETQRDGAKAKGSKIGDTTHTMMDQVVMSALHPALGPYPAFLYTAATGKDFIGKQVAPKANLKMGESQEANNVISAILHANSLVDSWIKPTVDEWLTGKPNKKEKPVEERAIEMMGPMGMKPHAQPPGSPHRTVNVPVRAR